MNISRQNGTRCGVLPRFPVCDRMAQTRAAENDRLPNTHIMPPPSVVTTTLPGKEYGLQCHPHSIGGETEVLKGEPMMLVGPAGT